MAFMVPLVKNHYEIYNTRSALSDHDNGYMLSASSNLNGSSGRPSSRTGSKTSVKTAASGTVVLNGIVLMNGRKSKLAKPKIVLTTTKKQPASKQQQKNGNLVELTKRRSPVKNQPQKQPQPQPSSPTFSTSTQSVNSTRSFPHVRRTVRNPITNRVYSYSVSIPEYVAEEDEEELARLELEEIERKRNGHIDDEEDEDVDEDDQDEDQVMIFSTSAPAGTGPIDNGILDIVDEDDFIRYTGARLPPAISSRQHSNKQKLLIETSKNTGHHQKSKSNQNNNKHSPTNETKYDSQDDECPSSNSREYMELLQKFILHLKMLKLKRIFNTKTSNKDKQQQKQKAQIVNSDSKTTTTTCRRSRSSTLDDSNNL